MAIAGAVELVKGLGAGPCAAFLEKLIGNITKVACGEALCQLAEEDEEEMEEEEEQEVLLQATRIHTLACSDPASWVAAPAATMHLCKTELSR